MRLGTIVNPISSNFGAGQIDTILDIILVFAKSMLIFGLEVMSHTIYVGQADTTL